MTVKAEDLPYRPCAGIMVLNADGLVWAGRRIREGNSEYDGSPHLWQMPQGGIDDGEKPLAAAIRELYEETGMKTVSLLAEASDWIHYDLPPELIGIGLRGKYRGQAQRWFAFRFMGQETEIDLEQHDEIEFDAWRWGRLDEAPDLIVPFKREAYEQVVSTFAALLI